MRKVAGWALPPPVTSPDCSEETNRLYGLASGPAQAERRAGVLVLLEECGDLRSMCGVGAWGGYCPASKTESCWSVRAASPLEFPYLVLLLCAGVGRLILGGPFFSGTCYFVTRK